MSVTQGERVQDDCCLQDVVAALPRDKVLSEKISTRVRVRPQFEAALALARQI
ncbi:recombinase family protein [Streptomyces anulatus]|uniref:hypothetical protein n=1 Tax=Streptomyces anulatus TaxID=1892 RepID=UPI002256BF9E|nr:hypothetical protein [Streptomyces anulatus]MCX4506566.1 hypothetical protein [Streptomyces anulatus]